MKLDLPGEVALTRWYPRREGAPRRTRSPWPERDVSLRPGIRAPPRSSRPRPARSRARACVRTARSGTCSIARQSPPSFRDLAGEVVLRPAGAPAPSGVAYSDADVDAVHIFVAQPPKAGPHPTYFFIHGGPECMTSDAFSPTVQAWVDHGFAVILVNYRGSTATERLARRDRRTAGPDRASRTSRKVRAYAIAKGHRRPEALCDRRRLVGRVSHAARPGRPAGGVAAGVGIVRSRLHPGVRG